MEAAELVEIVSHGEDSRHQFKVDVNNADSLAAELVAFSNSRGGQMFIGVADDNKIVGLSQADIGRINQLLSNTAAQNVRPPVNPHTENVPHPDGTVMVVTLPEGITKPHMDRHGAIWVKQGADKRRVTSPEEIRRMFESVGLLHADATLVSSMGAGEMDLPYFERFFMDEFGGAVEEQKVPLPRLLENMNLGRNGLLNVAGALLFGKRPEFHLPAFVVKAVAFEGTDIAEQRYIDSRDIVGRIADVFQQCLGFLLANTRRLQGAQTGNSRGDPEVPRITWEELVANALVHRNYFVSAPVRLMVFLDRVELLSPGHLPNNLTVENIKAGNSNIRNPILASFAAKLLPYRGLGSGIIRALKAYPNIDLVDDRDGNLFKVIVRRPPLPES